jgi:kynurenine formamidase
LKRILDLTLPLESTMRGVDVEQVKRLETHGWNATRLSLYSHCGTHMDAPRHFLPEGATIDSQPLGACIGPARLVDLTPVAPRELISVERLGAWREKIRRGDRLLLRTDWSRRHGTPAYRDTGRARGGARQPPNRGGDGSALEAVAEDARPQVA